MIYYEISEGAIRYNYRAICQKAGVPVWCVIKYDGYGTGLLNIAKILSEEGAELFAVSETEDLIKLRNAGFTQKILVLTPHPGEDTEKMLRYDGIFTVDSMQYAYEIDKKAKEAGVKAKCHIAVDTGLNRFGFECTDTGSVLGISKLEGIELQGVYSHLASAYTSDSAQTKKQAESFRSFIEDLEKLGVNYGMAHLANSPGIYRHEGLEFDAVRAGSALLGRVTGTNTAMTGLRRTGWLVTHISRIKKLEKGEKFGYGGVFKTKKPLTAAIVPGGPWSGVLSPTRLQQLRKRYSLAEVGGVNVPLIGSAGDGHSVIDVTGLEVSCGDKVCINISPLELNPTIEKLFVE